MSWSFLYSAIVHAQTTGRPIKRVGEGKDDRIDFNLGTPGVIILSACAVEAFVNEASSVAHSVRFLANKDGRFDENSDRVDSEGLDFSKNQLDRLALIRENSKGSFTERFKLLRHDLGLTDLPDRWNALCSIRHIRDGLVHFRHCDVPIANNPDGLVGSAQKLPEFLTSLKTVRTGNLPIVAPDSHGEGQDWTLRIATNAMAIWTLNTVLQSLASTVQAVGDGWYGQKLKAHYSGRNKDYETLFDMGLQEVANWQEHIENGTTFRSHFPDPNA